MSRRPRTFRLRRREGKDDPKKHDQRDRSKINMSEDYEVKYWTKELGVSKEQLQKAVDKVGNSAAAVRKELAAWSEGARYVGDLWSPARASSMTNPQVPHLLRHRQGVEFVNLHVAAELDVPIESFLKYAVAQALHFRYCV
jgi:hypothetical protein